MVLVSIALKDLMKRAIVEGDGAYQKGAARKCHDAHRIAVQWPAKSSMASFARVNRSGFTSGVDMLREVSIANTMSLPRRLICSQRYPTSGPASATNRQASAAKYSPRCTRRRATDIDRVN